MMEREGITPKLVEFARGAAPGEAMRATARLSLFDWAVCGSAGVQEPVADVIRRVEGSSGPAEASAIGLAHPVSVRAAAVINGATSHALDYDDTHFGHIGHPSVAVIPAVLGLAEAADVDGARFLDALCVGLEGSVRVGLWLGRAHYQIGFHQTATSGAFGATLGAGRVLGLTDAQLAHAMGLAATRAAGLKGQFGTMGKPYNAGLAAQCGVEVALLAAGGMQSALDGLEGAQGFGATHAGEAVDEALVGLGTLWRMEHVSYKFHACCHGLHAMLEALSQVRLAPEAVDRVTVTTHTRWMTVCNQIAPETGLGAKFSYKQAAAMAIAGWSTAALDSWSDVACQDPVVRALRERVDVVKSSRLTETQALVAVSAAGGREHALEHDLAAPVPRELLVRRLRGKAVALLGDNRAAALWEACCEGPAPDLPALTAMLRLA